MSRFTLVVALLTLAMSVNAQEEINAIQQQQSQGFLERIMSDYVYPLRDYDWRGMVRRLMHGVMDYIAPDAKEPKAGYPYTSAQDRTAVLSQLNAQEMNIFSGNDVARPLGSVIAQWIVNKANNGLGGSTDEGMNPTNQYSPEELTYQLSRTSNSEPQWSQSEDAKLETPLPKPINNDKASTLVLTSARLVNLNSNVAPAVADHSWTFLGFMLAYSIISIAGAVAPILKFPPEDPLLEPELTMPQLPEPMQGGNMQNVG